MARWSLAWSILVGCPSDADPEATAETGEAPEESGVAPTADTGPPADPCDACLVEQVCDRNTCIDPAVLVFLDLDATGTFTYDPDRVDAAADVQASDPSLVGMLPGYGSGPRRDDLLARVQEDFTRFVPTATWPSPNGIRLVTERPLNRDDYHRVVTTPSAPIPGQVGLGSPTNCGNQEDDEIFFAFVSDADGRSTQFQANIVAQAIGSLLGLGRVAGSVDIMAGNFPFDQDLMVASGCQNVLGTDLCGDFNLGFCPDGGQDTDAVLRFHARQGAARP
ncbi:MAG: hypothetical protein AAF211_08780 [Myxococcota bacterium]